MTPKPADALRESIDRGEMRDKVDYPDPSVAPLGTDAEAAGFPPSAAELAVAARSVPSDRGSTAIAADPRTPRSVVPWLYLAIAAAVMVAAVAVVMFAVQPAP